MTVLKPIDIVDPKRGEYKDGASWRSKGGSKSDNPYTSASLAHQRVLWAAGWAGIVREAAERSPGSSVDGRQAGPATRSVRD